MRYRILFLLESINILRRWDTFLDLMVLLAAAIVFFSKLFHTPLYYASGETLSNFFPLYYFMGDCYKSWQLPLWDPYYYFALAGINFAGIFYPPNIVTSLLISSVDLNSGFLALEIDEIAHYWMASFFMYLLMRHLDTGRTAAILSGILYAYSGFVVKSLQQPCIIHTITWFPLLFYFYLRSLKEGYVTTLLGGIVLAMCFLTGYLNLTIYNYIALFSLSLFVAYKDYSKDRTIWLNIKPIFLVLCIFFTGFLLAAPQNLLTLEYANLSIRHGEQDFDDLVALGSIPPLQLISFLTPQIYGATDIPQWIGDQVYVGFWEIVYYIGIFPLVLSLTAILFRKDYITLFFSFLFTFALFTSLGKNAAPAGWLYAFPLFPFTRIPARFTFFLDLSLAILAGLGLDYLLRNRKAKGCTLRSFSRYIGLATATSLVITVIFYLNLLLNSDTPSEQLQSIRSGMALISGIGQDDAYLRLANAFKATVKLSFALTISFALVYLIIRKPATKIILSFIVVFVATDLFHFTGTLNPTGKGFYNPDNEFNKHNVVDFLRKDSDIFRTSGFHYPRLLGHINKFFNLGYTGGFSHKEFAHFRGLKEKWGHGGHSWFDLRPDPASPLIDFYNIKYFITEEDFSTKSDKYVEVMNFEKERLRKHIIQLETNLREVKQKLSDGHFAQKTHPEVVSATQLKEKELTEQISELERTLTSTKGLAIFKNKMAFPRAFVADKYVVETDRGNILTLMEKVDLRSTVILEKQPSVYNNALEAADGAADIVSYKPTNVKIKVRANGGFLVLSDLYYPGWRAYINGKKTEIFRANYTFRAIQVPKGDYMVEFCYRPIPFYLGTVLAGGTFIFLCCILFMQRREAN